MSDKIKKILYYYLILGFVLGFSIALLSIIYELRNNALAFNIKNIIYIHANNKLLFVIDSAPFFLSLFSYFVARNYIKSYKINLSLKETTLDLLESRNKIEKIVDILNEKNFILNKSVTIDSLTGLNRETVLFEKNKNKLKNSLTLCVVNICYFREINTLFGNKIGDEALRLFAQRLLDNHFECYRLGGDEFAITYEGEADYLEIDTFANYIFDLISERPFMVKNHEIFLTINIGVAIFNPSVDDSITIQELVHNANFALKYAKDKKLQYALYTKDMINNVENNYNYYWKTKLITSVRDKKITAFYQPIINNKTQCCEKYEALIRIEDEEDTYISPHNFISSSKKYGLYNHLTKLIILETFERIKNSDYEISINISIDDIRNISTMKLLLGKLKSFPEDKTKNIVFELLESEGIENYDEVKNFIKKVKEFDCKIAIDDFGSGYSNFTHILNLNVDYIKIDASIIRTIHTDKNSAHIAKLIVDFAKKMGIKTIAEFVYSEEVFRKVQSLDIDYSQGFYFSEPRKNIENTQLCFMDKNIKIFS